MQKAKLNSVLDQIGTQSPFHLAIHYRGFLLLAQPNNSWLIRPERSPMKLLPFRTHICSLEEAKNLLDIKLLANKI